VTGDRSVVFSGVLQFPQQPKKAPSKNDRHDIAVTVRS
jgi:hypothetical protein